jgi:adenylylsulfate kinase-like enzyme
MRPDGAVDVMVARLDMRCLVPNDEYRSTGRFLVLILAGMTAVPVLWLYGPSGVGKTSVTWELFVQLVQEGVPTGYVDIDQLGMCYAPPTPQCWAPEPTDDPGRHRLQARTLDAVVANFQEAGARCIVVPGVTDRVRGVQTDLVPRAALTTCRLRAEPADLSRRLIARGSPADDLTEGLAYADALDRAFATDPCVDTTGLTVAEVVERVRKQTGWPELAAPVTKPRPARQAPDPTSGEILWLCGPTAIGKSTVGWQVYQQARRAGVNAAFVDLDQIGFHRPDQVGDAGNHRLKAANLAAVWRTFRAGGASCLIAVGPLDRPEEATAYHAALPAATITLCRLQASRKVLAGRVARRGRGLTPTWGMAGDELIGQPKARLREIADQASQVVEDLDGVGNLRVDTNDRPAEQIAAEILSRTGWPPLPR